MNLLVINGPNLNMLGIREPDIYGKETYKDLTQMIENYCKEKNIEVKCYQSNHEGALIDEIQAAYNVRDGIIINPGGYTHTSVALLDALKAVGIPAVEVHISDVAKREGYRQISYVREYCEKTISGMGLDGYIKAIDYLLEKENAK